MPAGTRLSVARRDELRKDAMGHGQAGASMDDWVQISG